MVFFAKFPVLHGGKFMLKSSIEQSCLTPERVMGEDATAELKELDAREFQTHFCCEVVRETVQTVQYKWQLLYLLTKATDAEVGECVVSYAIPDNGALTTQIAICTPPPTIWWELTPSLQVDCETRAFEKHTFVFAGQQSWCWVRVN